MIDGFHMSTLRYLNQGIPIDPIITYLKKINEKNDIMIRTMKEEKDLILI
jgi:hypothetical protein